MFIAMLWAGLGGFAGTICRYLTGVAAKKIFGTGYPVGTLAVNVIGCFIIGIFYGLWGRNEISSVANALLITGFCGGYTTFSSFSHDNYALLKQRQYGKFIFYVLPSIVLGLLMVWGGMTLVGYTA